MRTARRGSCALAVALVAFLLGAAWLSSPTSLVTALQPTSAQRGSESRAGAHAGLFHLDDAIVESSSSLHRASAPHRAQLFLLSAACEVLAALSFAFAGRLPLRRRPSHPRGATSRAPPFESFA